MTERIQLQIQADEMGSPERTRVILLNRDYSSEIRSLANLSPYCSTLKIIAVAQQTYCQNITGKDHQTYTVVI